MKRWSPFVFVVLVGTLLLWADQVSDLRPVADGGTEQWQDDSNTACSSVTTCWDEVDDASGPSCTITPSDGDTSYVHSTATANRVQTFDMDESGIPNGSTVQSAVVRACAKRGGTQNVNFRLKFCLNGTCTDSGTLTATSVYTDFNSGTIDFADDTKDAADDYEIGAQNVQPRDLRTSALEADVTFAPPAAGAKRRRIIITLRSSPASPSTPSMPAR